MHINSTAISGMKSVNSFSSSRSGVRSAQYSRKGKLGPKDETMESNLDISFDDILTWHKFETKGPVEPVARIGHTSCIINGKMYVFGGIVAGKRSNNLSILNLETRKWEEVNTGKSKTKGDIPSGRSHHIAWVMANRYMVIQGGEVEGPSMDVGYRWLLGEGIKNIGDDGKLREKRKARLISNGIDNDENSKLGPKVVEKPQKQPPQMGKEMPPLCTDDTYLYDTYTFEWKKIETKMTPMPRRGHTVSVVNTKDTSITFPSEEMKNTNNNTSEKNLSCNAEANSLSPQIAVVFGGYQPGLGYAEGLLDKNIDYDKREHIRNKGFLNEVWTICLDDAFLQGKGIWIKCFTNGMIPSPRYGHSANVVDIWKENKTLFKNSSKDKGFLKKEEVLDGRKTAEDKKCKQQIVVFGGIGPKGSLFNDVHFLDIDSMTWTKVFKPRGKPPPPRYHHTACIINSPGSKAIKSKSESKFVKKIKEAPGSPINSSVENSQGLLIYGGSMHVEDNSPNARPVYSHVLHYLDFQQMRFQSVNTGHAFPNSRSNHSLCILQNYQLSPVKADGTVLDENTTNKEEKKELLNAKRVKCKTFAVVYGGLNNMYVNPDTWVLALKWRKNNSKKRATDSEEENSSEGEDSDENDYEYDDEGNLVKKGCVSFQKFNAIRKDAAIMQRQLLRETQEKLEQEKRVKELEAEIGVLKQNLDESNRKRRKSGASFTKRINSLTEKNEHLESLVYDLQQLLLVSETNSILLSDKTVDDNERAKANDFLPTDQGSIENSIHQGPQKTTLCDENKKNLSFEELPRSIQSKD